MAGIRKPGPPTSPETKLIDGTLLTGDAFSRPETNRTCADVNDWHGGLFRSPPTRHDIENEIVNGPSCGYVTSGMSTVPTI
jgi:hypothetical protein